MHINPSVQGGAGRAAYRIHRGIRLYSSSVDSHFLVRSFEHTDESVSLLPLGRRAYILNSILSRIERLKCRRFRTANYNLHTTGWPGGGYSRLINRSQVDILNIHTFGDGILSIEDIPKLSMPVVWTMHDEWGFCGAEHYSEPSGPFSDLTPFKRNQAGYYSNNCPSQERGYDLNRYVWRRKQVSWHKPLHIVCPSQWLAESVLQSSLMKLWPVTIIPYPIETDVWFPVDKADARARLGLPQDEVLVLFGVDHGSAHPRKGADLLLSAFQLLQSTDKTGQQQASIPGLVVFGQQLTLPPNNPVVPYHYLGRIEREELLRLIYSAVDVVVIPSRQDNLPNVGLEAHACGTPVVAFKTGGLPDIVADKITGALAQPFDPASLAECIRWVVSTPQRISSLGKNARLRSEQLWSPSVVAAQYSLLYEGIRALGS